MCWPSQMCRRGKKGIGLIGILRLRSGRLGQCSGVDGSRYTVGTNSQFSQEGSFLMQADLAASLRCAANAFRFCRVPVSGSWFRVRAATFLVIALLFVFSSFSNPGYCVEPVPPDLHRLFHLVGIPGLRREQRVDLTLDADGLLFHTSKVQYQVPYARIHHVLLLSADRRYEGRTYAAAVATYGVGALLILKKHHVDTAVVDYVNERGGKMGIVVQMETAQGDVFRNLLKSRGISIDEPETLSESLPKQETGTDTTDRSKP
jgi:hypothetical protein